MIIDTAKFTQKVADYFAAKTAKIDADQGLSDKTAIARLNRIEAREIAALDIIERFEALYCNFN